MSESESEELGLESLHYRPKPKEIPIKKDVSKKPVKKDVEPKIKEPNKQLVKKMAKNSKEIVGEEELLNKRRLILMLQFYLIEFPNELKSFKKVNFEKKTFDELQDIQKEMDFVLGNNSGIANVVKMFRIGIQALEVLTVNFTPINCSGISEIICNDPDAMKDLKLIALKNSRLIQTEPEYRLAYRIVSTAMVLHSVNPTIGHSDEVLNNVNEKYKDL